MPIRGASERGLKWYQDARFGMFIHWGLYALLGRGEWVMHNERIAVQDYEPLMHRFAPDRFDAAAWVALAADAGQRYIVITSRHHDGFSMYDTGLSDYKVTNSPFRRDPLRELADACARRGDVKLGFYVSLLDWRHPAYRFRRESGLAWSDYIGFLHGQVRELCTGYGEVACIWFDGDWPGSAPQHPSHFAPGGAFEYAALYDMIHTLQPDAVVHNNRHAKPLPGEDVQGFEQDLPGQNTAGFNTAEIVDMPSEVCLTINDHWGYCERDDNHKPTRALIHTLARSAGAGANLLLNVGPTPRGEVVPEHAQRLREIGRWLSVSGESIYATRRGIFEPTDDATSTRSAACHYVHVLEPHNGVVALRRAAGGAPAEPAAGLDEARLSDGSPVAGRTTGAGVALAFDPGRADPYDTVITLKFR